MGRYWSLNMKRWTGAALALMLSACAHNLTPQENAGRDLQNVAAGLKAAANAADIAIKSGKLSRQQDLLVADDLQKAKDALDAAYAAYGADHNAPIAVELATVASLAAAITAIATGTGAAS
jgi:hypothetical protein